jgi:hypothetical protein
LVLSWLPVIRLIWQVGQRHFKDGRNTSRPAIAWRFREAIATVASGLVDGFQSV